MTLLLSPSGKLYTINGKLALLGEHGANCCCDVCCCERMYNVSPFRARLRMGCIVTDPCFQDSVEIELPGGSGYWDGYVTDWECVNPDDQLPIHVEVSCGPFPEIDPRPVTPDCNNPFGNKFWIRVTANGDTPGAWFAVGNQPEEVADCVGDSFYGLWGTTPGTGINGCDTSPGAVDRIEIFYP